MQEINNYSINFSNKDYSNKNKMFFMDGKDTQVKKRIFCLKIVRKYKNNKQNRGLKAFVNISKTCDIDTTEEKAKYFYVVELEKIAFAFPYKTAKVKQILKKINKKYE